MIRRLQQHGLRESEAPRAIGSVRAPEPIALDDVPQPPELEVQAYREAYAEGFKAGEEDGRREAEQFQRSWEEGTRERMEQELQALKDECEQLTALATNLHEQLHVHGEAMEQLAFELALRSLAQVLGSMQEDGALIRRLCAQMAEAYRGKAMKLEVSPADRAHLPERIEGLEVVAEHGLSAGQCRIATERGYAESSVADRLAAVYGAMLEALGLKHP